MTAMSNNGLRPAESLDNLLTIWEKLATRERKVFLAFGYRLWSGQRLHGELSVDKKDWKFEAVEEALDASVYLACMLCDQADKAIAAMLPDAEAELEAAAETQPKPFWEEDGYPGV